jgi:hypothetical protein
MGFATIHEEPFPLAEYCGIGKLGSVPLAPGELYTSLFCLRRFHLQSRSMPIWDKRINVLKNYGVKYYGRINELY